MGNSKVYIFDDWVIWYTTWEDPDLGRTLAPLIGSAPSLASVLSIVSIQTSQSRCPSSKGSVWAGVEPESFFRTQSTSADSWAMSLFIRHTMCSCRQVLSRPEALHEQAVVGPSSIALLCDQA